MNTEQKAKQIDYKSDEVVEQMREFHLQIGKRMENTVDCFTQENLVAKLLRCEVSTVLAKLSGYEEEEWRMALIRKEPEFAEEQGWMLSKDIPKELKPYFGPTFDYPAFEAFWAKHVPGYSVVDIDRTFNPLSERFAKKSWVEHIVAYLHHCPTFYKSADDV